MAVPNLCTYTRIAIVAGRSTSNACKRNRTKRRLRACMDAFFNSIKPGWDLILYARQKLDSVGYNDIQQCVQELLEKADLILMG